MVKQPLCSYVVHVDEAVAHNPFALQHRHRHALHAWRQPRLLPLKLVREHVNLRATGGHVLVQLLQAELFQHGQCAAQSDRVDVPALLPLERPRQRREVCKHQQRSEA